VGEHLTSPGKLRSGSLKTIREVDWHISVSRHGSLDYFGELQADNGSAVSLSHLLVVKGRPYVSYSVSALWPSVVPLQVVYRAEEDIYHPSLVLEAQWKLSWH
jgi:hypothetical protein